MSVRAPFELDAAAARGYLASRGEPLGPAATVRELGGGVSNTVLHVADQGRAFVIKQALPQLRVQDEWLADRGRILRERDALIAAAELLPAGWVPRVLWSDEENFIYAMEAFALDAESWKTKLLRGEIDAGAARQAGLALGLTIRGSWRSPKMAERFGDRGAFEQLRTDPYYRQIARRNPDVADAVAEWIADVEETNVALTHGDWSPKNMVVDRGRLVFIDYECAHFGDPSYDAAFVTNHLVLKAFHLPAWGADYLRLARTCFTWTLSVLPPEAIARFERRTVRHLGFLLLARIDGKSPAEYLTDEGLKAEIRAAAKRLIERRPADLDAALAVIMEGSQ